MGRLLDVLRRLRAALTPQALLALALLALLGAAAGASGGGQETALERRIARALSAVEGAGEVRVVIMTRAETESAPLSGSASREIPCGAVAVARGAGDPLVNLRLTQALCSLLGLPASAVSVLGGAGGR